MAIGEQAISYVRFSTLAQKLGDSRRRQMEMAQEWCDKHSVELLTEFTFHDLGTSAFRSKNSKTGQLADLLDYARNGRLVRGTYLVVESFDRITRDDLQPAISLLQDIVRAGLRVVTVTDGQIWDEEAISEPMRFIFAVMALSQGHMESAKKSNRITQNWKNARATENRKAFGVFPGWLRRSADGTNWEPIPERVAIIKRIFQLAIDGYGSYTVAKKLNAEGVPGITERRATWSSGGVSKILVNRAVMGEFEFKTRDKKTNKPVPTGNVIPDWYPQIIEPDMFHHARAVITSRATLPAKRRDRSYRNLFFGMAHCAQCGAPMIRRNCSGSNRTPGYGRYVCTDSHNGKTDCPTVHAHTAELAMIPQLIAYFSSAFVPGERINAAREAMEGAKGRIADIQRSISRLDEALLYSEGSVADLMKKRNQLVSQEVQAKHDLEEAETTYYNLDSPEGALENADEVIAAVKAHDDDETARDVRARFHTRLAGLVQFISIAEDRAYAHVKSLDRLYTFYFTDDHAKNAMTMNRQIAAPRRSR